MAKKKPKPPKDGAVWHLSAEEATLARKPHYNAHICRTGAHGSNKYDRARERRTWKRELNQEGTRYRGSLPFHGAAAKVFPIIQDGIRDENEYQVPFFIMGGMTYYEGRT